MGPLNIEIAFLNEISNRLEGSGWVTIYERTRMITAGRINNFLSSSKNKRSRYAHQVPLAAIIKLARQLFQIQNEYLSLVIERGSAVHSPQP